MKSDVRGLHRTHLMNNLVLPKRLAVALVLLAMPWISQAGNDTPYVEKSLGTTTVKLPKLADFSPACDENKQIAQRASGLTPKTAVFVACSVESKKWHAFQDGKPSDMYPFIAIAVQVTPPGGDYTTQEFEKVRAAAHKQLGDLLTNTQDIQRQIAEQDRKLASGGVAIERKNYHQSFQGFFQPAGETFSFSYVTTRNVTVVEAGMKKDLWEVNAASIIFLSGKLLTLNVVDQSTSADSGLRVQEITSRWLRAFRDLNENQGQKK